MQTFINLPLQISDAIATLLSQQEKNDWITRAEQLHDRYMQREKNSTYVHDYLDALAYLALRIPATYAQIHGAFSQVQEIIPSWRPVSCLDIGSGPGTAVWAAMEIWPGIKKATCIDQNNNLLAIGQEISKKASIVIDASWQNMDITKLNTNGKKYDLIIIANVMNELDLGDQEDLLTKAFDLCQGIVVIIEPGTSLGVHIIQRVSERYRNKAILLAPYINNSFVVDTKSWIHFSQRFIRPVFQRSIRQHMRKSSLMASDWEDTKYAYVALGKIPSEEDAWGRSIGHVVKQKGFVTVPILTQKEIKQIKIFKRNKKAYAYAKNLLWGEIIKESSCQIEE